MQLPNLLLHILALLTRLRHPSQRSLTGHATHTIIRTSLRTFPPRSLLLTNSLPSNRIKQVRPLARKSLQIVRNLLRR